METLDSRVRGLWGHEQEKDTGRRKSHMFGQAVSPEL